MQLHLSICILQSCTIYMFTKVKQSLKKLLKIFIYSTHFFFRAYKITYLKNIIRLLQGN